MSYQKVHYRHRHSFGWVPLVLFALFFFWGGWKLLFLLPMILLPLVAIWFFVPKTRRWNSGYQRGDWGNWGDWSGGFDGEKRKNDQGESDEAETGSKYMYEPPKRKNDDDVYYV